MKFSEEAGRGQHHIDAYGEGRIVIDGRDYSAGLIVSPTRIIEGWGPRTAEGLTAEHIAALIALEPQVIVLGTGARQFFLHPRVLAQARGCGLGVEVMDTGAACRTYNILLGEGRRVAAGLIPY
jgi:uncharacterized protein